MTMLRRRIACMWYRHNLSTRPIMQCVCSVLI